MPNIDTRVQQALELFEQNKNERIRWDGDGFLTESDEKEEHYFFIHPRDLMIKASCGHSYIDLTGESIPCSFVYECTLGKRRLPQFEQALWTSVVKKLLKERKFYAHLDQARLEKCFRNIARGSCALDVPVTFTYTGDPLNIVFAQGIEISNWWYFVSEKVRDAICTILKT